MRSAGAASTTYPSKFYNVQGATTTKHIFANGELVATIVGNGSATSSYIVHTDHLGGTHVVTNASGTVVQTMDYYPYGEARLDIQVGGVDEKRKFTGHEYDASSGLNYMKARYQDPRRGAFLSQDSAYRYMGVDKHTKAMLMDPQLQNSYSYARDNPMVFVDKDGKFISVPWIANNQWVQESATAAYQQNSTWRFAMDNPKTASAVVAVSTIPALVSGGSAAAAFGLATSPGVGIWGSQIFAGLMYSSLAVDSALKTPEMLSQFSRMNPSQQSSIFGIAGSVFNIGISMYGTYGKYGGYPGAIADTWQFANVLVNSIGSAASNLFSNDIQSRRDTASSFNATLGSSGSSGSSGGGGGGMPASNSLWVTPSGAVVTWSGSLVSGPVSK
ncbi:MAG: hypothetical protein A3I44_01700 [Candidatus Sungbacteria bacterium RIFCSPLOWO2_02_FULL_51_17]|nr:MAG: hypothetical protein A2676_04380 [Candidatus Sungbacteria bacterium RIFCSPHIGHO2_01_FULL_51_22]OHA11023.1 MAG: hypothetical protein A3I44_01700 [Candidatus Sungbacteria bacterium RIFCSPLOWO2_02_FULL_51_17]